MNNNLKKTISMILVMIVMMGSVMTYNYEPVYAWTQTQDHGFDIDENLFSVSWNETGKVYVRQTVGSWDSDFDEGVILGYAEVYAGIATSKKPIDGKYYQRVLVQAKMVPQTVYREKQGMSQYLTVKVANGDAMLNTRIEPASSTGSTSYSTTGNMGASAKLGVSEKNSKWTLDGGLDFTLGISSSSSYIENSLSIITNENDSGAATWHYDYISSGSSKEQNAYLFGSSTQYGLFMWNTKLNSGTYYVTIPLMVEATFGGGVRGTTERAEASWTDAHNLGSAYKIINMRK